MKRTTRPSGLVTAAAAALAVAALSGCSLLSEQATAVPYTPGDGSQIDITDTVYLRHALWLSDGGANPGTLLTSVVNDGLEPVQVQMVGEGFEVVTLQLDARTTTTIGPQGDQQVQVAQMGVVAGALVPLRARVGEDNEGVELAVPVLDATQPEFEGLVPTPGPTGSDPTPTEPAPTEGATATPAPERTDG